MLFTDDRHRTRQLFRSVWQKHQAAAPLEPLEKQIATLLEEHPEYHALLTDGDDVLDHDFTPDDGGENPFLHLGLHLALREQVGTDRPAGIRELVRSLLLRHGDGHTVEHLLLPLLAECLWEGQRAGRAPDELAYLERVRALR